MGRVILKCVFASILMLTLCLPPGGRSKAYRLAAPGSEPQAPQMPDVSHSLLAEHAAQSHNLTIEQVGWVSQGAWDEDHCSLTLYPPPGPLCFPGIPNGHHSWDPDTNTFWTEPALWGDFGSGLSHAKNLFKRAVDAYSRGDFDAAYLWLGRAMHMLGDVSTPAHVHLDTHLPGDADSYEGWLSENNHNNTSAWISAHPPGTQWDMDFHDLPTWDELSMDIQSQLTQASQVYGERGSGQALWELGPVGEDPVIFRLMYLLAEEADNWDSDDVPGEHNHGDLTDPGYLTQMRDALFPMLVRHSAALIAYFEATVMPPPAPLLISPADGEWIQDDPPTFRWMPVGVDPLYEVEISQSPDFSELSASGSTVTPLYTPATPLGGGTYYWRVRATTEAGMGDWSQVWSFQMNWRTLVPLVLSAP